MCDPEKPYDDHAKWENRFNAAKNLEIARLREEMQDDLEVESLLRTFEFFDEFRDIVHIMVCEKDKLKAHMRVESIVDSMIERVAEYNIETKLDGVL